MLRPSHDIGILDIGRTRAKLYCKIKGVFVVAVCVLLRMTPPGVDVCTKACHTQLRPMEDLTVRKTQRSNTLLICLRETVPGQLPINHPQTSLLLHHPPD
mmetsp:Transcript_153862/g.295026  ORF Transcript_153862/g.295026 Transcript_153862/m.295026 type:complete len:100 (-) Transcript_153862:1205-1504(-)